MRFLPGQETLRRLSVWPRQGRACSLAGGGALSEWMYGTSYRCRCGTLLLYKPSGTLGSGFRILALNCGGAMRIRAPDLLHAIQVFSVTNAGISRNVTFPDPGVFALFDLPPVLNAAAMSAGGP
jgi:hypothetical protein